MTTIDNAQDIIDSRDVIERLRELRDERQELADTLDQFRADCGAPSGLPHNVARDWLIEHNQDGAADDLGLAVNDLSAWDDDNGEELAALEKLNDEGESVTGDWTGGETLIRESYFEEYCQELLEDIGDLPRDLPHYLVIGWEATAKNLRVDYSEINFAGVTYLIR